MGITSIERLSWLKGDTIITCPLCKIQGICPDYHFSPGQFSKRIHNEGICFDRAFIPIPPSPEDYMVDQKYFVCLICPSCGIIFKPII